MLATALDFLFPPQCLQCGERIATHGGMCAGCWGRLSFISDPFCKRCGVPFEYAVGESGHCAGCLHTPPPFSRARAVFRYDDASRRMIFRLKYHDQTSLAAVLGPWLAKAGHELAQSCDVLVPVPLYYWRYLRRRYNQAALLAQAIGRSTGLPCLPDALLRTRATAQQTGLSRKERKANVEGAFAVNPAFAGRIKNANIALIDDVYTTGATLSACTETLIDAGAGNISVLTLARRV